MTRSLSRRLARRGISPYVRGIIPVTSPYTDRLKRAAVGDHVCGHQLFVIKETA